MIRRFLRQSTIIRECASDLLIGLNEDTSVERPTGPKVIPGVVSQNAEPAHIEAPEHQPGPLETGMAQHQAHFEHPDTRFAIKKFGGKGANAAYVAKSHDNRHYFIKPHTDVSQRVEPEDWGENGHKPSPKDWEEPEHWEARNHVANRVLDAMGMSHMGVHTFRGQVPDRSRGVHVGEFKPYPLEPHEGKPAQVSVMNRNAIKLNRATPEQLNKVDAHHRLAGLVHGILTNNPDAHHGNVLLDPEKGHPVHIPDNDLSFSSRMQKSSHLLHGQPSIMSVYGPGEALDYRKGRISDPETGQERELGRVDKNFPPNILQAIHQAAAGKLGHGLSDEDHATMIQNAHDLLNHGLEGTMKMRNIRPTYIKQHQLNQQPAVLPNEKDTKPLVKK